jgi:hypothetical protein
MSKAPFHSKNDAISKLEQNLSRRKMLQIQFEEEYLQALVSTKEKILRMEGPDIKEAIQDDFRQWYMEYKRIYGNFPEFPKEEQWKKPDFKFTVEKNSEVTTTVAVEPSKKDKKEEPKKDKKKGDEEEKEDPLLKFNFGTSEYLVKFEEQYILIQLDKRNLINNGKTKMKPTTLPKGMTKKL